MLHNDNRCLNDSSDIRRCCVCVLLLDLITKTKQFVCCANLANSSSSKYISELDTYAVLHRLLNVFVKFINTFVLCTSYFAPTNLLLAIECHTISRKYPMYHHFKRKTTKVSKSKYFPLNVLNFPL